MLSAGFSFSPEMGVTLLEGREGPWEEEETV